MLWMEHMPKTHIRLVIGARGIAAHRRHAVCWRQTDNDLDLAIPCPGNNRIEPLSSGIALLNRFAGLRRPVGLPMIFHNTVAFTVLL